MAALDLLFFVMNNFYFGAYQAVININNVSNLLPADILKQTPSFTDLTVPKATTRLSVTRGIMPPIDAFNSYPVSPIPGRLQDRMAGGKEEYNAFFYSLVSTDTQEMYYSTKRQQFLIDQGYSFKVITGLPPPDSGPELNYNGLDDQNKLLTKVITAGDDQVGLEILDEDADDIALQKGRRSMSSMSSMSGANGKVYMEYNTGRNKSGHMKSKPKDPTKRHQLFKKRFAP